MADSNVGEGDLPGFGGHRRHDILEDEIGNVIVIFLENPDGRIVILHLHLHRHHRACFNATQDARRYLAERNVICVQNGVEMLLVGLSSKIKRVEESQLKISAIKCSL